MIKVDDNSLLDKYITNSGILDIFSTDINPYIDLLHFNKGEFLINEGECSNYLYFLVNGKLKVFSHSSSGKIMSLYHFNSFEIIGETCSLWDKPPTASVQTTSACYCIGISMKHRDVLLNDIKFLRYTCKNLGERLSYMNNNTCINLYDSLENRLASFILRREKNGIFSYNLTECAELLCTSYRHLLRVINSFCASGKLEKNKKSYKILDRDFFENISSY